MDRIGAHSKREIRRSQRELYARLWPKLLAPAVVLGVGLVFLHWILPDLIASYVTAALAAIALCQIHQLGLDATGMTSRRIGIMAEQWTADELHGLDRKSWNVIHHVMLEYTDVDHVAVGPPGVIAVETKFRSSWERVDLDRMALDVARQRRDVAGRARQKERDVRCVVAMWGPDVGEATQLHGVVFVPGKDLGERLCNAAPRFDDAQRASAVDALDGYLTKRDVGEVRDQGAVPASLGKMANQTLAVVAAALATAYLIATAAKLPSPVAAALATAAVVSVAALRWRLATTSAFGQRLTTAVLATALGLGVLLGGAAAVSVVAAWID